MGIGNEARLCATVVSERRELYGNEREISLDVFMPSRTSGGGGRRFSTIPNGIECKT